MSTGVNSSAPTTAEMVGGVYNVTPPVLVDGQATALQVDVNGKLITSGGGAGSSNVTIVGVAPALPLTQPLPVELSDGTQAVGTAGNPLSVNVITGGGSNASVSTTGTPVPASATMTGGTDGTNLRAVRVDTDGTVNEDLTKISGSAVATAAAGVQKVGVVGSTGTNLETTPGVLDENIKNVGGSSVALAATGIQKVGLTDGTGTAITSTGAALDVNIKTGITNPLPVSGTVTDNQGTAAANTAGWPITSGGLAEVTAAWTSATGLNTALQINTVGYATAVVTLSITGSITGGVVIFEASDTTGFTNAYQIVGLRSNQGINTGPGVASISLSGLVNTAVVFSVAALGAFRVRLSTVITNTGTLNVGIAAAAMPNQILGIVRADGSAINSSSSLGATNPADNLASNSIFATSNSASFPMSVADAVYGGAFSGTPSATLQGWSKLRTPTVFRTVTATASGNTALWTPGTGNKFRMMRYMIEVTGSAAATAADLAISFQDAAAAIGLAHSVRVGTAVSTTATTPNVLETGWIDLGNGFLSAAANNALNVNLSSALTGGVVRVTVCGTEE